jgi:putative glutamine amidotransferase
MASAKVALLVGREPAHRYSVHHGYVDALWASGATPVLLAPPPDLAAIDRYVEAALACDALCVTGGGDVDPTLYGATPEDGLMDVDPHRDAAEVAAVRAAVAAGHAVLGVCRGVQVVAVAFGGSLHQDLPRAGFIGHWAIEREYVPAHSLDVEPGSAALAALGGGAQVNSIHHQAVRDPGPDLTATAWSPDGVIEAVEAPGVLGVQWHPERLWPTDERHIAPFRWLMAA